MLQNEYYCFRARVKFKKITIPKRLTGPHKHCGWFYLLVVYQGNVSLNHNYYCAIYLDVARLKHKYFHQTIPIKYNTNTES